MNTAIAIIGTVVVIAALIAVVLRDMRRNPGRDFHAESSVEL